MDDVIINTKIVATLRVGGNPNGEKERDNAPREYANGIGYMSPQSLIRKIRDTYFDQDRILLKQRMVLSDEMEEHIKAGKNTDEFYKTFVDVACHGLTYASEKCKKTDEINKLCERQFYSARGAVRVRCESVAPLSCEQNSITTSFVQSIKKEGEARHTMGKSWDVGNMLYIIELDICGSDIENGRLGEEHFDYLYRGLKNLGQTDTNYRRLEVMDIIRIDGESAGRHLDNVLVFDDNNDHRFSRRFIPEVEEIPEDWKVSTIQRYTKLLDGIREPQVDKQ